MLVCLNCNPAKEADAQAFKLLGGANDDLERLDLFKRVVYLVNENYVEPQRIQPASMFMTVLKKLEEQIPEVRVLVPSPNLITLQVNRERLRGLLTAAR
jgi:hypothetical protein